MSPAFRRSAVLGPFALALLTLAAVATLGSACTSEAVLPLGDLDSSRPGDDSSVPMDGASPLDSGNPSDAAAADATTRDSGTSADAGTDGPTGDSATADSSATTDAGDGSIACAAHLPPGFSQVLASSTVAATLTGQSDERGQAMVLDENDDPMFVYSSYDTATSWSVNFTRWDPCAGGFTTPVLVDTMHPGSSPSDVAVAYDPTTKEIGISYVKADTDNDWVNDYSEVWLATKKAPATAFTLQRLSVGSTDFGSAGSPSIAMASGRLYLTIWQGPFDGTGGEFPNVVWFLADTATPTSVPTAPPAPAGDAGGDAGGAGDDGGSMPDASSFDAGPPPPHYFTYTAVPFAGTPGDDNHLLTGYVDPVVGSGNLSVACDSTGAPSVAMFETPDSAGDQQLLYWKAGASEAVSVYSFNLDGDGDLSLAFDGTKPRIAGHVNLPAGNGPDSLGFVASDDGVTWGALVHLPSNGGAQYTAFDSAMALDGLGNAAVASDINSSTGGGCGYNPYVARASIADGGAWTACGADVDQVHGYGAYSVSSSFGRARLAGKLAVTFITDDQGDGVDGGDQAGIVYWLSP